MHPCSNCTKSTTVVIVLLYRIYGTVLSRILENIVLKQSDPLVPVFCDVDVDAVEVY